MALVFPSDVKLLIGSTNVINDVISGSIVLRKGISSNSPTDFIFSVGTLSFELNNSITNSSATEGLYSPDHDDAWADLVIGATAVISFDYGAVNDYILFSGKVRAIRPASGKYGSRRTRVDCTDFMDDCANFKLSGLGVQVSKTSYELIDAVIDAMPVTVSFSGDTGDTFPYAFDDIRGESTTALTVFQRVMQSQGGGQLACRRGNNMYLSDRTYRYNPALAAADVLGYFADEAGLDWDGTKTSVSFLSLDADHSRDNIVNHVKMTTYPRNINEEAVIYSHAEQVTLGIGQSETFVARYMDENNEAERIAAINVIEPVAGTDYVFSIGNANLGVVITDAGNSCEVTLTNNGPKSGTVTLFQIRGDALLQYAPIEYDVADTTSQNTYGDRTITFNMQYQDNFRISEAVGDYLIARNKDPKTIIKSLFFSPNQSDNAMDMFAILAFNNVIRIADSVIGIDGFYWINGYELNIIGNNDVFMSTLFVSDCDTTTYFVLDTSELDDGVYLAP